MFPLLFSYIYTDNFFLPMYIKRITVKRRYKKQMICHYYRWPYQHNKPIPNIYW